MLQIIAFSHLANLTEGNAQLDFAEFFAGQCAVTNAFRLAELRAVAFEYDFDNVCNDFMSRAGYAYAVSIVMRLEPGAVIWLMVGNGACCHHRNVYKNNARNRTILGPAAKGPPFHTVFRNGF